MLEIAAERGDTEIMRYLLKKGADPNWGDGTALPVMGAVLRSQVEALQILLLNGADVEWLRDSTDLLWEACMSRSRDIVALLLDTYGALGGDWSWVDDTALLHTAVCNKRVKVVQLLLERAAVVDALSGMKQETALVCAAKAMSIELVEVLLEGEENLQLASGGKSPLIGAKKSTTGVARKGLVMVALLTEVPIVMS